MVNDIEDLVGEGEGLSHREKIRTLIESAFPPQPTRKINPRRGGTSHRNKLHALIVRKFRGDPAFVSVEGTLRTPQIARTFGFVPEAVYKWLRADIISPRGAKLFEQKWPDRFRFSDFLPYLDPGEYHRLPESKKSAPREIEDLI